MSESNQATTKKMAGHQHMVSELGSVRMQSDGENGQEHDLLSGNNKQNKGQQMTRDKTEEIKRDTTIIRVPQTLVDVHTREVYEGEGIEWTGQLFAQQRETEAVLSADQLQKQMEGLRDKDAKYQLAHTWFTAKLDEAQEDSKQFITAWDLVQKIRVSICEEWDAWIRYFVGGRKDSIQE